MSRKIFSFLLVFLIALCYSIPCFAKVQVDGVANNSEWENCSLYLFETPESFNNSVEQAFLRASADFSENKIYLCVMMKLSAIEDYLLSGVDLSFEKNENILLNGNGESEYNTDLYDVNYGLDYDVYSKNVTYEICVGFKMGVELRHNLVISLIDTQNHPSNKFEFELDFSKEETTAQTKNQKVTDFTEKSKTSATKKGKTTVTTTDDFTFKKAEKQTTLSTTVDNKTKTTAVVYLDNAVDNKSRKEKIYIVSGVVGTLAVVTAGVYHNIRKNKQADNK